MGTIGATATGLGKERYETMPLPHMKPGDLITTDDWNALVDAINSLEFTVNGLKNGGSKSGSLITLELTVNELENGGLKSPPSITQGLPTGTLTAGDEIIIFGSHFGYSQGVHSVFVGNTPVTGFLSDSGYSATARAPKCISWQVVFDFRTRELDLVIFDRASCPSP